jgi:hypothetical protein
MEQAVLRFLLPASLAVVMLIATALLFLAGPAADDFCRAMIADLRAHAVETYLTHAGRWLTVGFLVPLLLHRIDLFSPQYGALLLVLWIGYFATFLFLIRVVIGPSAGWRTSVAASLLIGVVWWCGLPAPGQTIYWASAGLEYGLGFQAAAVLFGLIAVQSGRWAERGAYPAGAAVALGTLLVTGFHEIVALCVLGLLVVMTVYAFIQRLQSRFLMLCLTAVALVGAAVSLFAPGNAVRAARGGASPSASELVYSLYLDWYQRVIPWLTDPRLLCLSFLLLSSARFATLQPRWRSAVLDRHWWLIPIVTLLMVFGCLAVPAVVLGQPGPGRLHNLAYSIFVVGWFLTLFSAGRAMPLETTPAVRALRTAVGVLFVAAILFTGNMQDVVSAITGRSNAWQWHRWVEALEDKGSRARMQGRSELVLSDVPAGPRLYVEGFQRAPDRDPASFINRCLADYLGLSLVIVDPASAQSRPK